jgi:LmbE family N-acetylglucosaminyl deacetylase
MTARASCGRHQGALMLHLTLGKIGDRPLQFLCLGAHSDDIEIGAGGTVLSLLNRYPQARVHWIVFSANDQRAREARASAAAFLAQADQTEVQVHGFRDGFFPDQFAGLKAQFEELKTRFNPDLILTHTSRDSHQDHRVIAELTWNTFRDHLILEYEVIKYDPDLGNPNVLVPLDSEMAQLKVDLLLEHFTSQRAKRWFTAETLLGMMHVRGVHAAATSGLAEGFYARKLCL